MNQQTLTTSLLEDSAELERADEADGKGGREALYYAADPAASGYAITSAGALRSGEKARVVAVDPAHLELRCKLFAMGVTTGRSIQIIHKAPLGCPLTLGVYQDEHLLSQISLRKSEAQAILVTRLPASELRTAE